ncbi:McrC family protein [Nibrella saemangeumensis]|uniref:McrC family protein n=1 Tax=Nibrella saemangeumensis TaxID=1084526 RepID=A0ABP8NGN3_9BACT
MPYAICEYGLIRRAVDFANVLDSPTELYLPDESFDSLKTFIAENDADAVLTYGWQKGKEVIRTRNYVGLLETREGVQVEIWPKVHPPAPQTKGDEPRRALLTMLRHLRDSPFRHVAPMQSGAERLPLWEVFIQAFLDEITVLLTRGLQKAYVSEEADQRYLRGKLHLPGQIRRNTLHAERVAVICDEFTADLPPNRLLKTGLLYLRDRASNTRNQSRIRQLLFALDEVPPSVRVSTDWQAARAANRLFVRYGPALQWVDVLLRGQVFGMATGRHWHPALLFPMERIFEDYVAAGFRKYAPDAEVLIQESSQYLISEHGGSQKFKLRPDIVLYRQGPYGQQTLVLDTKWKTIDGTDQTGTYGIDQADLYQLYAYGKKYNATELVLIYPANETFRHPLTVFGYDATMQLRVVPFDVLNSLETEVRKILTDE